MRHSFELRKLKSDTGVHQSKSYDLRLFLTLYLNGVIFFLILPNFSQRTSLCILFTKNKLCFYPDHQFYASFARNWTSSKFFFDKNCKPAISAIDTGKIYKLKSIPVRKLNNKTIFLKGKSFFREKWTLVRCVLSILMSIFGPQEISSRHHLHVLQKKRNSLTNFLIYNNEMVSFYICYVTHLNFKDSEFYFFFFLFSVTLSGFCFGFKIQSFAQLPMDHQSCLILFLSICCV